MLLLSIYILSPGPARPGPAGRPAGCLPARARGYWDDKSIAICVLFLVANRTRSAKRAVLATPHPKNIAFCDLVSAQGYQITAFCDTFAVQGKQKRAICDTYFFPVSLSARSGRLAGRMAFSRGPRVPGRQKYRNLRTFFSGGLQTRCKTRCFGDRASNKDRVLRSLLEAGPPNLRVLRYVCGPRAKKTRDLRYIYPPRLSVCPFGSGRPNGPQPGPRGSHSIFKTKHRKIEKSKVSIFGSENRKIEKSKDSIFNFSIFRARFSIFHFFSIF